MSSLFNTSSISGTTISLSVKVLTRNHLPCHKKMITIYCGRFFICTKCCGIEPEPQSGGSKTNLARRNVFRAQAQGASLDILSNPANLKPDSCCWLYI